MSHDIAVVQPTMLTVIEKALADPKLEPAKLQQLLDIQMQIMAEQRKIAFSAAMGRLQARLPQIDKYGQGKNSKFAKLEDIDIVIRPLLADEGFSFSFDEESHTDKTITFIAWLAHQDGHREAKRLTVPLDTAAANREGKAIRPAIQDAGSTVSYARRYLIKMHLNIVEKGEDTDGESRKPITEEQARDIEAAIDELKMNKGKFLIFMGVGEVKDILARDLKKAINAIDTKRNSPK